VGYLFRRIRVLGVDIAHGVGAICLLRVSIVCALFHFGLSGCRVLSDVEQDLVFIGGTVSASVVAMPATSSKGTEWTKRRAAAAATTPTSAEAARARPGVEACGAEGEAVLGRGAGVVYAEAGRLRVDEIPKRAIRRGRSMWPEEGRAARVAIVVPRHCDVLSLLDVIGVIDVK
jgi:hypothetical protein